jgi:hypothetical protein
MRSMVVTYDETLKRLAAKLDPFGATTHRF